MAGLCSAAQSGQAAEFNSTSQQSIVGTIIDEAINAASKALDNKLRRAKESEEQNSTYERPRGIYTPEGQNNKFEGLFREGNRDQAISGDLQWPRAALTFVEYGSNIECWTIEARIWTNSAQYSDERFKTCLSALLIDTDALGNKIAYDKRDPFQRHKFYRFQILQPLFGNVETTGNERTPGPNPPRKLFQVQVPKNIERLVEDAIINSMWVSGFITVEDTAFSSTFMDWRMWIAGFKPEGNKDRPRR